MTKDLRVLPAAQLREGVVLAGLICVLAARIGWHVVASQQQATQVSIYDAKVWMADALPGVGEKTRGAVIDAVRAGQLESIPKRAQPMARELFRDWPEEDIGSDAVPAVH